MKRNSSPLFLLATVPIFLALGCTDKMTNADDTSATAEDTSSHGTVDTADNTVCIEDYSVCGDLIIPEDFAGTPRSLVVALYGTVPPAGPPDGIIVEIDSPNLVAGEPYPIRELPVLFTGTYYIWVSLYNEGGGDWEPVNNIDYTGSSTAAIILDGAPISFDDIPLQIASGW